MASTQPPLDANNNFVFDSLAIAKQLQEEGGYTRKQAETQAKVLAHIVNSNLATKRDVELVRRDIELARRDIELIRHDTELVRKEMKEVESRLRKEIKNTEVILRKEMKELELRMIIKLGSIMLIGVGLITVLDKLL